MRLHLLLLLFSAAPLAIHAAPSPAGNDPAREYEQVRKIALRDPKVREAYERADDRLETKMLEIDPGLRPYMNGRRLGPPVPAAPARTTAPARKAAPVSSQKVAPTAARNRSHVVARGETLSSIAAQTGVSVAELRRVNHIADERKLAVGTALAIPARAAAAAAPTRTTAPAARRQPAARPAKSKSWWDRAMNSVQ